MLWIRLCQRLRNWEIAVKTASISISDCLCHISYHSHRQRIGREWPLLQFLHVLQLAWGCFSLVFHSHHLILFLMLEGFFLLRGRSLTVHCEIQVALAYLWNWFIFGTEMLKPGNDMAKHELIVIAWLRLKLIPFTHLSYFFMVF